MNGSKKLMSVLRGICSRYVDKSMKIHVPLKHAYCCIFHLDILRNAHIDTTKYMKWGQQNYSAILASSRASGPFLYSCSSSTPARRGFLSSNLCRVYHLLCYPWLAPVPLTQLPVQDWKCRKHFD